MPGAVRFGMLGNLKRLLALESLQMTQAIAAALGDKDTIRELHIAAGRDPAEIDYLLSQKESSDANQLRSSYD